jgi:hypothetical protein
LKYLALNFTQTQQKQPVSESKHTRNLKKILVWIDRKLQKVGCIHQDCEQNCRVRRGVKPVVQHYHCFLQGRDFKPSHTTLFCHLQRPKELTIDRKKMIQSSHTSRG